MKTKKINKTEVESVQLGNTYIADMDVAWTNVMVTFVICCIYVPMTLCLKFDPNRASNS